MRGKAPEVSREDVTVGEEIEVFVKSPKKDESGWRRPCKVVSIDDDGNIDYRWQGTIKRTSTHLTRKPAPKLGIFALSTDAEHLLDCE